MRFYIRACMQAAAVDESTRFRRLFKLPDGEDLLVVVSGGAAPEDNGAVAAGPLQVAITTSSPNDLVLHWGVSKQNDHSWVLPPKALWSGVKGSVADAGGATRPLPHPPFFLLSTRDRDMLSSTSHMLNS